MDPLLKLGFPRLNIYCRFGEKINPEASVVRVAVDVYKGDTRAKHDIKISARLQNLYKKHFNLSDEFFYQYFGQ